MKYPNWDAYTDEQKDKAVAEELRLETHNGTTKDDLLNIIRYLAAKVKEAARSGNKCEIQKMDEAKKKEEGHEHSAKQE